MSLKDFLPKKNVLKKASKVELAEANRLRALVKEQIYPILLKNAKNIRDARVICKNFVIAVDAAFYMKIQAEQKRLSTATFSELDLKSVMNKGKENAAEWLLSENLKNEKTSDVKALIDGLDKEITRLIEKDMLDKPLSELKTEWL